MIRAPHRVLIVDDETLARRRLRQLIAQATDFEVVGECADARTIEAAVHESRPDVVLLDVQMPFADGFASRDRIAALVRHVVFVTAHPEHGARAFDVEAVDYLVKPVTQARFDAALQRLRRALAMPGAERVLLGGRQGGATVALADVRFIEADGAYVSVHANGQQHVLRESLEQAMDRLGRERFVRIHRSMVVHLAHIRRLRRARTGTGLEVELADGTRLPISRRRAREVLDRLHASPAGHSTDRTQQQPTTDGDAD